MKARLEFYGRNCQFKLFYRVELGRAKYEIIKQQKLNKTKVTLSVATHSIAPMKLRSSRPYNIGRNSGIGLWLGRGLRSALETVIPPAYVHVAL